MYSAHYNLHLAHRVRSTLQRMVMPLFLTILCSCDISSPQGTLKSANAPMNEPGSTLHSEEHPGTYIGFINKFDVPGSPEVYIHMYFNDSVNSANAVNDLLYKSADSTIYKDEEISRLRIPNPIAKKYFHLQGLSTISIFNSQQKFICHASLVRVEYFDQPNSSEYIAVYLPEKSLKSGSYYAQNQMNGRIPSESLTAYQDQNRTNELLKQLKAAPPYQQNGANGSHYKISGKDTLLSIFNTDQLTYIVLSARKHIKVLYKSPDPANAEEVLAISLKGNQLPCLLMRNVQPDTDVYWDELLFFNGQTYSLAPGQRLP